MFEVEPRTEEVLEEYAELKAACERLLTEVLPGSHASVRAGLIVGPHDPTGRFTYWPLRVAQGGDVLAPAPPERRVQFVDARDLGDWLVHVAEERIAGTFNAGRPAEPFGDLLEVCREVSGSDARFVWVDEAFLLEREVGQWMELPLWLAGAEAAFIQADVSRAVTAGLRFRPVAETVADTLAWAHETGAPLVAETDRLGAAGCSRGARPSCWAPGAPASSHRLGTKPWPTRAPETSSVVHGGTIGGVPRGKRPQS